jgi:hypothetical protein
MFALLWVLSLTYIFWPKKNYSQEYSDISSFEKDADNDRHSNTDSEVRSQDSNRTNPQISNSSINDSKLYPIPNSQLSDNDLNIVSKQIIGKTVSEVVDIIFLKNPREIGNYYGDYQRGTYAKKLVEMNPNCFRENKCIRDKLEIIPSFKVK